MFKKVFLRVYEFIKRIYLFLFNFMIGRQTKKTRRIYVHIATTVLLIGACSYLSLLAQLLIRTVEFNIEYLSFLIMIPFTLALLACMVKFMMHLSSKKLNEDY